ncbi:MAG: hypothetical protein A4S09_14050 [Proteobacteria bacterium SG_bin7]|nr:MAG: hypothetical protein A4S09_14050 [Proteobacteria bacterium SG_bin7]
MSNVVWNCEPKFPENVQMDVGRIYDVTCSGPSVAWIKSDLEVEMPQDWKHFFHVVDFDEVTAERIKFSATSYKTGEYRLPNNIVITDGENRVTLTPWNLKIESVVRAQPGMEPQPYGPFGPFLLEWPLWMWITLGVFVVSAIGSVLAIYWERRRKKIWANIVAGYTTALKPYHQFYKDYRRLSRLTEPRLEDLSKLNEAFRLYFLRELKVPTLKEPPSFVLKWLKKRNPSLSKNIKSDLFMILREMESATKGKLSAKDFEQMSRKCQQIVDEVYEGLNEVNS